MQRDIPVCEAFGLPGGVQGIVAGYAAVNGEEDVLSLRRLAEGHIVSQPAFHTAPFIVIGAGALFCVFIPVFKTIQIKLMHIVTYAVLGIVYIILGPLFSWIGSWTMYGLGLVVESVENKGSV